MKNYSSNPGIQKTIECLLALGCPPIPVAPKQDARRENCHHIHKITVKQVEGSFCRISLTRVGDFDAPIKGDYCRLDEKLQPIARFTGKNPSYLDDNGQACIVAHRQFQDRLPTEAELRKFFRNPDTGVGTLGGHGGVVWLDFDAKNYASQEECDRDVEQVINKGGLEDTWIERTGSGGWRIAVRPKQQPNFTNFATAPDGEHIGEALCQGRFTVLAPTIHPNGKFYHRVASGEPIEIESLEAIGVYPTRDEVANQERAAKRAERKHLTLVEQSTDPAKNPYDIRNFAQFLIGYRVEGEWVKCKCPAHNGISDNSLHIRVDMGAFKCWSGCDTTRIYQEAKTQAIAAGYELPKGFQPVSDAISERQRYINRRRSRFLDFWRHLKQDFQISGRKFTFFYNGYAPTFKLERTIALQGWLGSGKTEAILRSLLPHKENPIVWMGPTNGLLRQTAERAQNKGFDIYHLQDDNELHRQMLRVGQSGMYLACPDSCKPYAVGRVPWEDKILVIDEFSGIRETLLQKSVELPQVLEAIARCQVLIVADAFLSDVDLKILETLREGEITVHQQQFQKSKTPVKWVEGLTKEGAISLSHDGVYYPLLRQWIVREGIRRIAIAVDSVNTARQLKRFIEKLDPSLKVWLTCSHTIEENQQFLLNPDALIAQHCIDVLIYSPTIQSGADIQSPFDRGLLIAGGVLSPIQMIQMLGRCRQCREWYVSAPRKSQNPACTTPSLNGKKIQRWSDQLTQVFETVGLNAPFELQKWGVWQRLVGEIEAAFNSEYLELLLQEYFESVDTVQIQANESYQWRCDRKQLKREDAERTLKANLKNGLRLLNSQKPPSTNAEVWDVKLAALSLKYPSAIQAAIEVFNQSRNARVAINVETEIDAEEAIARNKRAAIDTVQLFSSSRVERLKYWVMATERRG